MRDEETSYDKVVKVRTYGCLVFAVVIIGCALIFTLYSMVV
jgi:hypothetical protein